MKTIYKVIGAISFLTFLILGFLTIWVKSTPTSVDYWGRPLENAPLFIQWMGLDTYPGYKWFIADMAIAFFLIALGKKFIEKGYD